MEKKYIELLTLLGVALSLEDIKGFQYNLLYKVVNILYFILFTNLGDLELS